MKKFIAASSVPSPSDPSVPLCSDACTPPPRRFVSWTVYCPFRSGWSHRRPPSRKVLHRKYWRVHKYFDKFPQIIILKFYSISMLTIRWPSRSLEGSRKRRPIGEVSDGVARSWSWSLLELVHDPSF